MKLTLLVSTATGLLLANSAAASTPLFRQLAEAQEKIASDCTRHGQCYDMRLQNVQGCTDGWTLHGLWPPVRQKHARHSRFKGPIRTLKFLRSLVRSPSMSTAACMKATSRTLDRAAQQTAPIHLSQPLSRPPNFD